MTVRYAATPIPTSETTAIAWRSLTAERCSLQSSVQRGRERNRVERRELELLRQRRRARHDEGRGALDAVGGRVLGCSLERSGDLRRGRRGEDRLRLRARRRGGAPDDGVGDPAAVLGALHVVQHVGEV